MKLEISPYIHIFERSGHYYLFNTVNNFFCEIDTETYHNLKDNNQAAFNRDEIKFLRQKKVLLTADEFHNILLDQKLKYQVSSYQQDVLGLVLVPTTACNFACPYCFEQSKPNVTMSYRTAKQLIKFINTHPNAKSINLTWYGGEPLLAIDRIKRLLHAFETEIKIPIEKHHMVTNGYLLTPEVAEFMGKHGLQSVQITLDGPEEMHNRTRCLKGNGNDTFERILKNIDSLLKHQPQIKVSVRVNVDKANADAFFPLYKDLAERWSDKNIYIYPGFIRQDTPDGQNLCSRCITVDDGPEFFSMLSNQGANLKYHTKMMDKGCMANQINSYIVGPRGEIYKCWNDVSNPKRIVGYIHRKQLSNSNLLYKYMTETSPFDDPACQQCDVMTICSGGCAWYRMRNKFENGRFNVCSIYKNKQFLEDALLYNMANRSKKHTMPSIDV